MGFIYSLRHPNKELIVYIGQTKQKNPRKRLDQHIYDAIKRNRITKSCSWIRKLDRLAIRPIMEIVEQCPDSELDIKEQGYIRLFKALGANLKNHTEGGKGTLGLKLGSYEKVKNRKKGYKRPEHSEKMKLLHKEPNNFGNRNLSCEERNELYKKASISKTLRITIQNDISKEILEFFGRENLAKYFNCYPAAVSDFLNDNRKSKIFKDWKVISLNKNKYDSKSTPKKKK